MKHASHVASSPPSPRWGRRGGSIGARMDSEATALQILPRTV
jgi:hypothetical protein